MARRKSSPSVAGVFLCPGASGTADHPVFVALEELLAVPVRRYDFAHVRAGRGGTPRADRVVPEVVEAVCALAAELGVPTDRLVIGGRSYGGRVCSMAVAGGLAVAGLVLLSYPLHPPGRPEQLRTEHLPALAVPTLVVSGDRDPFGTPDELTRHFAVAPGPVTTTFVTGGTHDPRRAGREDEVVAAVAAFVDGLGVPGPARARR
jgi:predicted alpha/beta-hydrolase family hydrolase